MTDDLRKRIRELEAKIRSRENNSIFKSNIVQLKMELARLEKVLASRDDIT